MAGEPLGAELVLKVTDHGHRQLRELHGAQQRHDVEVEVLAVAVECCSLQSRLVAAHKPQLAGFGDGDAFAVGQVRSLTHIHGHRGVVSVRFLPAIESLDVSVPALIAVID
jgi:hypothetical protein